MPIRYTLMASEKYNDLLQKVHSLQSIGIKIDNDALDILELFAQRECLTIAEITRNIKSTKIERVYKNVHGKVQKLKTSNLIEEVDQKSRYNEKYKLTDDGIYQLFLKRLYGILADQLSIKKGQTAVSHVASFLKHYGDNLLFELFLYPYFETQTISNDNFDLVVKLFRYLHDCCVRLDLSINVGAKVPFLIPKFSWNKIPGRDEKVLLTSLKRFSP